VSFLSQAKCTRCHATATGDTFEQASQKLNHAIGLGRGIKCGASYDKVVEIKSQTLNPTTEKKIETPKEPIESKSEEPEQETKKEKTSKSKN